MRISKRRIEKMTEAAQDLESACADAFASLWYYERDSEFKAGSWGHAAISKAERGLATLKKLHEEKARVRRK